MSLNYYSIVLLVQDGKGYNQIAKGLYPAIPEKEDCILVKKTGKDKFYRILYRLYKHTDSRLSDEKIDNADVYLVLHDMTIN